jgi:hypothetical protein
LAVGVALDNELDGLSHAARVVPDSAAVAGEVFEPALVGAIAQLSRDERWTRSMSCSRPILSVPRSRRFGFAFAIRSCAGRCMTAWLGDGASVRTLARRRRSPRLARRLAFVPITSSARVWEAHVPSRPGLRRCLARETHLAGRLWATADQAANRLGAPLLASERQRYKPILTPLTEDQRFQEGNKPGASYRSTKPSAMSCLPKRPSLPSERLRGCSAPIGRACAARFR